MSHVTPQNPQSSTTGGLPVKLNASTNDTTVSANSTNTFFLIGSGGISVSGDGPTNSIVFSGSGASFTNNVASGATGRTTLTAHGVMLGEGVANVNVTAPGSSGQVLIGSTGADPMFSLITSSAGTLSFVVGAGQLNIEVATAGGISGIVGVASGGTGRTILTSHGVVLGEGASIVNVTAAGSSGQVLIGSTGLDPAFALITSSAGTLSFVLGPNLLNIEVASSGGITGIVGVASGGTGRTVFTSHGVLIGEGSNEVNATLAGTNGQVLIGSNGLDPVFALITSSANTLSFTLGAGLLNIEVASAGISGVVGVVNGGTGRTVLTSHGVLLGEGSNNINVVPVGTNGQVLIGATNADPAFATFSSMSNTLTFVFNPSNLSIDINSPVSITYGGTNATSFGPTTSSVLYYNGNGIGNLNAGSAGQVLVSQGYGIAPSFLFIGTPSQINISDNTGASVSSSVFSILGNTAAGFPIYTAFTGTKLFINITSIPVTLGGTGQTILTNHGILIGAGTNNVTVATQGTDGQLLIGSTTGDPAFATLSSISNTLTFVVGHNSLSVDLVAPVRVPFGGTGRTVLTTSGVLLGEGSNNVNVTAAGTDGQVLIGSSTGDPAFATISSITGTMTFVINHNNLSIDIKAPVPLAYGGTNNTNYGATASVVYFDGTKLNAVSIGTNGQVLISQGPGLPPVFQTAVSSGTVSTIDLEGSVIDNSRPAILKVGTNFVLGVTTTSAQYDIWATSVFAANPGTTYNNVYGASLTPIVVALGTGSVGNIFGSYVNLTSTAG
ncbi:MAG: hypothetical protein JSS32_06570, partial [Verrucomicrobia bacterium]|nr:hypothetical protein [Verrucomicrobiota bacterium]